MSNHSLRTYARQIERENHGHVSNLSEGRRSEATATRQPVADNAAGRPCRAATRRPCRHLAQWIVRGAVAAPGVAAMLAIGRPDAVLFIAAGLFGVAALAESLTRREDESGNPTADRTR